MAAPNAFTNELEKWVYQKCIGSIVFVEFRPKKLAAVKTLWNEVVPITGTGAAEKQAKAERDGLLKFGLYCTGFVVRADDTSISILTCAHVLGDSFSRAKPITIAKVNELFRVLIICDHHEHTVEVAVERISLGNDMILLSISRDRFHAYCLESHPPVPMAPNFPEALEKCVMVSWPPLMHRTAATGEITHAQRVYENLSCTNPKGYTMRLAQVDIASEGGSSGAPLLNGSGEFLCTLHAGFGGKFSYFICFQDLRDTLLAWGVLEDGDAGVDGGDAGVDEGGAA